MVLGHLEVKIMQGGALTKAKFEGKNLFQSGEYHFKLKRCFQRWKAVVKFEMQGNLNSVIAISKLACSDFEKAYDHVDND